MDKTDHLMAEKSKNDKYSQKGQVIPKIFKKNFWGKLYFSDLEIYLATWHFFRNYTCDDRRPVSTSPRPISNFKINRKTLLYIYFILVFINLFSLYVKIVYIFSVVPHWIPQGNKLCWKTLSIALNCKYFTVLHL